MAEHHKILELQNRNYRILLAEDNIINQQVAKGILNKIGLQADSAANGMEVINALKTIPYDLVLMDIQMPEVDGLEATRQIRSLESGVLNHKIPIIAMTAYALQGDREKCLEAGMNGYVSKPIYPAVLMEALEKWLPLKNESSSIKPPVSSEDHIIANIQVFDLDGLISRLMGDKDLAVKVTDGFLNDIPKQINALKDYLKNGDAVSAGRQAHSIKGASANIGGEAMRAVAFDLEEAGNKNDLEAILKLIPELEDQFALLKEAIIEFIK